jgi:hypothetical protein
MRQKETFGRLGQSIVDAAKQSTEEQAKSSQEAAALVVNSVGSMVQSKRAVRPTAFSEATDFLGDPIKAARETKLAQARDNKETDIEQLKAAKSLPELLAGSAQDSE